MGYAGDSEGFEAKVSTNCRSNRMAFLKSEDHFSLAAIRLFVKPLLVIVLCVGPFAIARAQDSQSNKSDESWPTTAESKAENTNPARTMESHTKSGNRSIDKQRVEVLGPDGHYQPDSDTGPETTTENNSTPRPGGGTTTGTE